MRWTPGRELSVGEKLWRVAGGVNKLGVPGILLAASSGGIAGSGFFRAAKSQDDAVEDRERELPVPVKPLSREIE